MTVIIWSKQHCPACEQAKSLLISKQISFEERKLGENWSREQLLASIPTARTVPQIIMNGEYIGGFNELKQALA